MTAAQTRLCCRQWTRWNWLPWTVKQSWQGCQSLKKVCMLFGRKKWTQRQASTLPHRKTNEHLPAPRQYARGNSQASACWAQGKVCALLLQ